jgi:hypothetical protein
MRRLAVAAALAALVIAPSAFASGAFSDVGVTNPTLAINAAGEALVTYMRSNGQSRHVLVWGAINALQPSADIPQVRFRFDYSGGWGRHHDSSYWEKFKNACRPYDGPQLADVVAVCKAPDGSYWALAGRNRCRTAGWILGRRCRARARSTSPTGRATWRRSSFTSTGRKPSTTKRSKSSDG